jgi:glycosyltransferase involved in cell wall biosynthesis
MLDKLRIALVHDWLTVNGGAERVLSSLHELFPQAPIYTTIYNPANFPEFKNAAINTSYLNNIPQAQKRHPLLIPLMPKAIESFNLQDFDLIISDSHACAKGAIKRKDALHICYCHTPLRYVWFPELDSRANSSYLRRFAANRLKKWDLATIDRVDKYFANSRFIQQRIKKIYDRNSDVIYPPVDTEKWQPAKKVSNYFLYVSRLVDYKRPDIIIEAFNKLGLPLKIVGQGPEYQKLKSFAMPNIEFLGRVSDETLKEVYSQCLAFIYPSIEDFGIVPVEVMASGRPVLAISQGGAAETVIDSKTGLHFNEQTPESIVETIKLFNPENFNPNFIRQWAETFDKKVFQEKIKQLIENFSENM